MGEKPNAADEESAGAGAEQRAGHVTKMNPLLRAAPASGGGSAEGAAGRMKFGPALGAAPAPGGGGAAMKPGDPIPDIDVTLKQDPGRGG
jgi:hypothetical protein